MIAHAPDAELQADVLPGRRPVDRIDVDRMPHSPVLDGFRALAIGLVMAAHLGLYWVVPGGFGVTVFFFLSGFLITSLLRVELARSGTISLKGFYLRRFFRIIPPLWLTMIVSAAVALSGLANVQWSWQGALSDVLFVNNYVQYFTALRGFPGMPLWSLAVEEHFYLLFPLLLLITLPRIGPDRLAAWCAAACAIVLGLRFVSGHYLGLEGNYYMTHTRIDSILFGSILALWQNPVLGPKPVWRPNIVHLMLAIAALLLMLVIRSPEMRQTVRYSVQGIALFVVFSWALQTEWPLLHRLVRSRPIQLLALYSYTMYLVHYIFIYALGEGLSAWLRAPLVLALSWIYCAVMFRLVERPLARLRQRMNRRNEVADPALSGATGPL